MFEITSYTGRLIITKIMYIYIYMLRLSSMRFRPLVSHIVSWFIKCIPFPTKHQWIGWNILTGNPCFFVHQIGLSCTCSHKTHVCEKHII